MAKSCKYVAPNGNSSKLYDGLIKKYGADTALASWLNAKSISPSRKEGNLDNNGELTVSALESMDGIRHSFSSTGKEQKLLYHTKQAEKLKDVFAGSGIDITIEIDTTAKVSGQFMVKNNKPTVRVNPDLIKDDTIFHEFGHIYVDLLGIDNPLIKKGIEQLRNTELWFKIATVYPDLSETALAKEVLTTAIGIEATKLKDNQPSKFQLWINTLFRNIAELLGVDIFAAKLLAEQLVTGNLQSKLDGKYEIHVQEQRDLDLVNNKFMDKYALVEKALGTIKKKINTFYKNIPEDKREEDSNYVALKELETALLDHTNTDVELGLVAFITQSLAQTSKLEKRIDQKVNPTVEDKANGKDKISVADLRTLMKYNSTFSLADELMDLMTVDTELEQYMKDAGLYADIIKVQQRHAKVKKNATRLAIKLMAQRFTGKGNSKVEGIRREELKAEYNRLYQQERKAARKKDRMTFSDKENTAYKAARNKWVEGKIKNEASELALKNVERFTFILQQTNQDISSLERLFVDGDAINDEIIQVVMEMLDEADFRTMTETNAEYDIVNDLFERYSKVHKSGSQTVKYDPLIEDEVKLVDGELVKTGKKTKFMVSEYYSAFLTAYSEVWEQYNRDKAQYGEDSSQAEISLNEAISWSYKNEVTMPDGSVLPKGKWRNPQFSALKKGGMLKSVRKADASVTEEMYDYLINRIETDDTNLPYWAKLTYERKGHKWYRLPAIKKKGLERVYENGLFETIKDRVKNVISKDSEGSTEFGGEGVAEAVSGTVQRTISVLADEEGNEKHDIPINFRYDIANEDQSFDLPSLMLLNFSMARNYENKETIQADVELTRELLKERKVVKEQAGFLKGSLVKIDKLLDTGLTNQKPIVTDGVDSNAYKAFESIVEDRLYGISTRSSVRATKIANVLAGYTGNVLLVGNYLSSGANLAAGAAFNWMGRIGGEFYTATDITKASAKYTADIMNIVADMGKIRYSSKTNLLMEKFNALSDWSAVAKKFADDSRFKQLAKSSSLHAMNGIVEHSIQNVLMYAILNNTKVRNAAGEYLTKDGTTDNVNEAMSMDEAYSVVDGKLVLDSRVAGNTKVSVEGTEAVEFAISRMIRDLNAYLQGQYSQEKRSEIQRYWYGKLIMLLRKWLPRGLKYRWAGVNNVLIQEDQLGVDDFFYSRALRTVQEGYYTTTIRFIHGMWLDLKALRAQVIMEESRRNMRALIGERWDGLSDQAQGNIHKTLREAVTMVVLIFAANALKELGDEDKDKEKLYYLASFWAIRLQKEMLTYLNPAEFTKTVKSPSAALIMIDRVLHFMGQLTTAPTEVYATGRRKGTLKIAKDLEDLFPIFKHIDRDVDEALSFMLSRRVR